MTKMEYEKKLASLPDDRIGRLRREIYRVRVANGCERWRKNWNSDMMVSKELEALLDHVEKELEAEAKAGSKG